MRMGGGWNWLRMANYTVSGLKRKEGSELVTYLLNKLTN
jgi:hypothetical protein